MLAGSANRLSRTMTTVRNDSTNPSGVPKQSVVPSAAYGDGYSGRSSGHSGRANATSCPPSGRFNKSKITIGAKIGEGGYGKVHRCTDTDGNIMAVKCVATHPDLGLPALMECSVMSVINHPNINRALYIHANHEAMYIVQDLARSDLAQLTRAQPHHHSQLRVWIHGIAQAMACLHRQDIVHGDVKASNVLLYTDNTVRLSDFTLATRMSWIRGYHPGRYHSVCTSTHRPLEVWLGKEWDLSVDVWALGCTVFELVYGYSLFPPPQKGRRLDQQGKDQAINVLIDWGNRHPDGNFDYHQPMRPVDYEPVLLPEEWDDPNHVLVNSLIMSLLHVDPSRRPKIADVLRHQYFDGLSISPYMIVSTPANGLSSDRIKELTAKCEALYRKVGVNPQGDTVKLAVELFARSLNLHDLIERDKLIGALWIAHKLVTRKIPPIDTTSLRIGPVERIMCSHLAFRLHTPIGSVPIRGTTISTGFPIEPESQVSKDRCRSY